MSSSSVAGNACHRPKGLFDQNDERQKENGLGGGGGGEGTTRKQQPVLKVIASSSAASEHHASRGHQESSGRDCVLRHVDGIADIEEKNSKDTKEKLETRM